MKPEDGYYWVKPLPDSYAEYCLGPDPKIILFSCGVAYEPVGSDIEKFGFDQFDSGSSPELIQQPEWCK